MGRTKTIDDEEILRHARKVFRDGGHAASTRDVARAADISQAVLYQRFGSKEDLFFKAMTPEAPDLEALLGPYPPRNARDDLQRIGERFTEYLVSLMPTLLHVLAHPHLSHARLMKWHQGLPFHALLSALADRFERFVDDGLVGRVDPGASARAFLAVMHSAALFETMSHGASRDSRRTHVDGLVDVLWGGLAPREVNRKRP